jgi:hypothetical protein
VTVRHRARAPANPEPDVVANAAVIAAAAGFTVLDDDPC